jgi:hypothetical protein
MGGCSAPHCGNNTAKKRDKEQNISTHKFPLDPKKLLIIILSLTVAGKKNRNNKKNNAPNDDDGMYKPSKNANLCSNHYKPNFINMMTKGTRTVHVLTKDAVPTEFCLAYKNGKEPAYTNISTSMTSNEVCIHIFVC